MKWRYSNALLVSSGFVAALEIARIGLTSSEHPVAPRYTVVRITATEQPQLLETPPQDLRRVLAEHDPIRRRTLLGQWAATVDTASMEKTMARVGLIDNPTTRTEVCRALLTSWIQRDLEGVAGWFGQEGSQQDIALRMEARPLLLAEMSAWEPERALIWLDSSLSPRARDLLYEPFFLQWAVVAPAVVCAKLYELTDGQLLGQVAARWASEDLPEAVNWVTSLPDGPVQSQAMLEVSYRWSAVAPEEAAIYAMQTGDPSLLRAVVGKWADQSPQAAAEWVAEWPASMSRDSTLAHLAHIWAQNDPEAAATYTENMPAGAARDQAMVAVATAWAYAAPDQSAQWVNRLAEGTAREQALTRLISAWAATKPKESGLWIKTLPRGGSTDFAMSAYSSAIMEQSPKQAFDWATAISHESMRNQQIERVASLWMSIDQASARLAIARSNLPENVETRLLANAE